MAKSVLEKYEAKGWLKGGLKIFSAKDRLWAARKLHLSYLKSKQRALRTRNMELVKVDETRKTDVCEARLDAMQEFLEAFRAMPLEGQKIVECVVFQDKELKIKNEAKTKEIKKAFVQALDCLTLFYYEKLGENRDERKHI